MVKKRLRVLFVFSLILSPAKLLAYYEFDSKLSTAHSAILSLYFDEADKLLAEERNAKPGNSLTYLYLNYIDFLKAFLSEEEEEFELLKKNSADRSAILEKDKSNSSSPFYLYAQSEMLIQQALVRIKFGENISSANEVRKAYKLISDNEKLYPDFILNKKVSGFLHSIIGAVPPKYKWVTDLAGMKGSVSEGLRELEYAYNKLPGTNYKSYTVESLFYIANIYSIYLLTNDSLSLLPSIKSMAYESPLIAYIYSNIVMKQGKNDEAIDVLNTALKDNKSFPFYFLYYKRGIARLRKLDMKSISDFQFFLNHYQGRNNIKSAYQKIAWIKFLNGDDAGYNKYLSEINSHGKMLIDEDREAAYEAEKREGVNKILLRSRLYFDGGYYKLALQEISGKSIDSFPSYRDQLEVTYRLARIMQMSGKTDKAVQNYIATIKNGSSSKYHYAANSALFLGNIYEKNGDKIKAKEFYEKCLSMDYDQYKNSIDQKAKAGLERLK